MMPRKREAWEIEGQTIRNVADAIDAHLRGLPKGESRSVESVWLAMESCGVSLESFNRAIFALQRSERIRKIKDRLYPPARRR